MSEEQALGEPVVVMITSPLETEFITQIAEAFPGRIELIHRPDLMPPWERTKIMALLASSACCIAS